MGDQVLPATKKNATTSAAPPERGILQRKCACGQHSIGGEECDECQGKSEEKLQRAAISDDGLSSVPPVVHDVLRSTGQPLDTRTLQAMGSRFGHDFSQVRVHSDQQAAESARSVNALAYTVGRDVVFGAGEYAPGSTVGKKLLAHELTHVVQQQEGAAALAAGAHDASILNSASLERQADEQGAQIAAHDAERVVGSSEQGNDLTEQHMGTGSAQHSLAGQASSSMPVQRQPASDWGPGWWEPGWADQKGGYVKGWNKGERKVGKIRRLPLDHIALGNQDEDLPRAGTDQSAKGRVIVLIHEDFKDSDPAQVLLHFHGWKNIGYRENKDTGRVRDEATDRIEQQLQASNRPQMVGVLPQGNFQGEFGKNATGKTFNSDAYLKEVFATLRLMAVWNKSPSIDSVILSGHSHAGELINESMLSGSNDSSLPSKLGELVLFDAINGPREFAGVKDFLKKQFNQDIKELQKLQTTDEKRNFLKRSLRFRVYHTTDPFYTKWIVGPLPKDQGPPLIPFLDEMFKSHETDLGGRASAVYGDLRENYKIVATGHGQHEQIVGKDDRLTESIGALHRSPEEQAGPQTVPHDVYDVLRTPGQPLEQPTREVMEGRFGQDFSRVRLHTDRRAAESARAVNAQAYTVGHHVVFGAGQYSASANLTQKLLTHELTHVVQQGPFGSVPFTTNLNIVAADHATEREANAHAEFGIGSPAATTFASGLHAASAFASPVLHRQPATKPIREAVCEATTNPKAAEPGDCTYREPENCPTYEQWITTFTSLKSFDARATPSGTPTGEHVFKVLGAEAATREPKTATDKPAAPPFGSPDKAEKFIDHPTDEWVKTCLPDNLRETAYRLPSDCADIAVILRHVWLSAHNRTETFGKWTIGSKAGKAEAGDVGKIIGDVYTGNVGLMVNPYTDKKGQPLRAFSDLAPLLHAGDILVWSHFDNGFDKGRTGGHTHTIASVNRDASGKINSLGVLQGNEPIFGSKKPIPKSKEPEEGDDKTKIIRAMKSADTEERRTQLGHLPGRRIESASLTEKDFGVQKFPSKVKGAPEVEVWRWGADTLLVVAGPPKAAQRPPMKAEGKDTVRRITDWLPSLRKATRDTLFGAFEAAMYEVRAMIDGGRTVADDDARSLGQAAGETVWRLAKDAKDLGEKSHFRVVMQIRAMLQGFRGSSNQPIDLKKPLIAGTPQFELIRLFGIIDEAFNFAARGSSDIKFSAPGAKAENVVKTLLTGFDPFNTSNAALAPRAGEWNPSGAAVLALDGKPIKVDKGVVAAVEGVVLPVSFTEFKTGMVEKIVKPLAKDVDAVLTVSVDPGITAGGPVRLERYAVGSHLLRNGVLEQVPAAPGGGAGAAIIETEAPLEKISAETEQKTKGKPEIPAPTFGNEITFRFSTATIADAALKELGLKTLGKAEVDIDDHAALQKVIQSMKRDPSMPGITFTVNGKNFHALIVSGPGGNFLSNEVSYRVLRLLAETKSPKSPLSFHTHTEAGNLIPQDTSTPAAKKARNEELKKGRGILDKLITTLQRMIQSVAKIIMARRKSSTP